MCVRVCGLEVVVIVVGARIVIESCHRRGIRPAILHGTRVRGNHVCRIRITIHRTPTHGWLVCVAHRHCYVPDRAMLCTFGINIATAVLRASVVLRVYLPWFTYCTRTSRTHRTTHPYVQTHAYVYSRTQTHTHEYVRVCVHVHVHAHITGLRVRNPATRFVCENMTRTRV